MVVGLTLAAASSTAQAQEPVQGNGVSVVYDQGLEINSSDGNWRLHMDLRGQFRFSYPFDENVDAINNIADLLVADPVASLELQRARWSLTGHAYRPWLGYFVQYDFLGTRLLDLRFALSMSEAVQIRVGQWKTEYNRERSASSRAQQLVDRSIVNDYFTIDRQQGLMLLGRVFSGSTADSRYYLAVTSGNGRGAGNDDEHFLWSGRYQWNLLGQDLEYAGGDLNIRDRPAAGIAVSGATNRSPCTAFSSSGCQQLPGFEEGQPGQYSVRQLAGEVAFKHRGFSTQCEAHWKRIDDNVSSTRTELRGGYAQLGLFPHAFVSSLPRPLEIAVRAATVDPDRAVEDDDIRELTVGANWFLAGHRNKLTADASVITALDRSRGRVRLQWDVTF